MKSLFLILSLVFTPIVIAETLATVGEKKISREEFERKYEILKKQVPSPPSAKEFLESLVRFEVALLEAEKQDLADDPAVKERLQEVLYSTLLERELQAKLASIKIRESEMKAFYKKNPEIQIAHILISMQKNSDAAAQAAARARALEILNEVRASKRPFEELASLHSEDTATKELGGNIGYQSRVTLPPAMYDAAIKLKRHQVYGPVETPFGLHIIKLLEQRDYDLADKSQLRAALMERKRADILDDYFLKTKKKYKIKVYHDALGAQP